MSKIRTNCQFPGGHLKGQVVLCWRQWTYVILVVGAVWVVSPIKIKHIGSAVRLRHGGVSARAVGLCAVGFIGKVHRQAASLQAAEDLKPEGFSITLEDKSSVPFHRDRVAACVGQGHLADAAVAMKLTWNLPDGVRGEVAQTGKAGYILWPQG